MNLTSLIQSGRPALLPLIAGVLSPLVLLACTAVPLQEASAQQGLVQAALSTREVPVVHQDGYRFRDLNRNARLDPYEDWRLAPAIRAEDLLQRMTLEEKAGAMLHGSLAGETQYDLELVRDSVLQRHVNHLITRLNGPPAVIAAQNNAIQALAEDSRLGIPLTISTDPRHHFQYTEGASLAAEGYTQWPEPLGFAALRDPERVRAFADIARREYRAVGIHMGLSPQADLATEPRWSRINGTFGEDPHLARRLVGAYVEGFQGGRAGLHDESVSLVVKHWVGYGAAEHGYDSHNYYGRYAVFPGGRFQDHIIPFLDAFDAGVAGVMPTYSILKDLALDGQPVEQTGAGFSRLLLTDLLRQQHGFDGVILSDWAITRDCPEVCLHGRHEGDTQTFATLSTAWGVLDLSMAERFALGIEAGIDQFGGTEEMAVLLSAVNQGLVSEARLDASVHRLMTQKFALGLFERPFVDEGRVSEQVNLPEDRALAEATQRQSQVLLENPASLLPLAAQGQKLWLYQIEPEVAEAAGFQVVERVEEADLAIIRSATPYETLHPDYVFGAMQHEGRLDYADDHPDWLAIQAAAAHVPTIVSVTMDRPAILAQVKPLASALLANFGASDTALLDVITGVEAPQGRLPFDLPADMDSVLAQYPDAPFDLEQPLYRFGFGLDYTP